MTWMCTIYSKCPVIWGSRSGPYAGILKGGLHLPGSWRGKCVLGGWAIMSHDLLKH